MSGFMSLLHLSVIFRSKWAIGKRRSYSVDANDVFEGLIYILKDRFIRVGLQCVCWSNYCYLQVGMHYAMSSVSQLESCFSHSCKLI